MSEDLTDLDASAAPPVIRRRRVVEAEPQPRDLTLLGVVCAVVSLVVATGMRPTFTGSQNRYLVHLVAQLDGGPIGMDPLVRSVDPAPVFSSVLARLVDVFDMEPTLAVLWVIAGLIFFFGLWSITGRHVGRNRTRLLLWTALMALIGCSATQGFARSIWDGFDGFTSPLGLRAYLVPQSGVALAVLGSVLAVRRQRGLRDSALPLGAALVLLATILSPAFSTGAMVLLIGLAAGEIWGRFREPRSWALSLARMGISGVIVGGIAVALNRNVLTTFFGMSSGATKVLAPPHGVVPPVGMLVAAVLALACVVGAGLLALSGEAEPERRVGRYFICGGVIGGLATLVSWLGVVPFLSLLAPWQSFLVLVPLSVSYLVGRVAHRLPAELEETPVARVGLYVAAGLAVALGVLVGLRAWGEPWADGFQEKHPELLKTLEETQPESVGLVPSNLTDLRLAARVAISGDRSNSPIGSSSAIAWHRNIELADEVVAKPSTFCESVDVDRFGWALLPLRVAAVVQSNCPESWSFTVAEGQLALAIARPKP